MKKTLQSNFQNPRSSLEKEIASLGPWFHNLHLRDGSQTAPNHPLGDFPAFKWRQIDSHLPTDLSGWRALDIGCNAGFYSFELARRGAEVTAIDRDPHYLKQAAWAAQQLEIKDQITFRQLEVYELAHVDESYDLVWFMGVLYHLRYPLLALDLIARKTDRLLVFQAMTLPDEATADQPGDLSFEERDRLGQPGWPKMAFIEHRLAGDPTNWWIPNTPCVQAMLRSAGFKILDQPEHEIYLCEPAAENQKSWKSQFVLNQLSTVFGIR